jgi:hypothetical protein
MAATVNEITPADQVVVAVVEQVVAKPNRWNI